MQVASVLRFKDNFAVCPPSLTYSARQTFFPPGKQLDITLTGTTVAYHEVTAATAAALKDMPSMITSFNHGKIIETYILPPIV